MKDKVFVNLDKYPKVLQKKYFHDLQELAFSKNIGWINTGKNYESYMSKGVIFIQFAGESRNGVTKYIMYSSSGKEITYRDLIKKLKAL